MGYSKNYIMYWGGVTSIIIASVTPFAYPYISQTLQMTKFFFVHFYQIVVVAIAQKASSRIVQIELQTPRDQSFLFPKAHQHICVARPHAPKAMPSP